MVDSFVFHLMNICEELSTIQPYKMTSPWLSRGYFLVFSVPSVDNFNSLDNDVDLHISYVPKSNDEKILDDDTNGRNSLRGEGV